MTSRPALWLVLPGLLLLAVLMGGPVALLALESLKPFVPGSVRPGEGWTLAHYRELLQPAYLFYFYETFRIGLIVAALSVIFGAPLAFAAVRSPRAAIRKSLLALLVGLLVMSLIARLYAIEMAWGSLGPLAPLGALLGIAPRHPRYAEVLVGIGLLHFTLPVVALMLVGTFRALSPRLEEAAASLGATRSDAVVSIVLPLAAPGLVSAFLVALAMCISNFVAPLVLGRGVVVFTTSLMYTRFADIGNYPSGAAIGITMLILAFLVVYGLSALARRLIPR
jgi:ABC-type spermidine/putrescine transport system permease subunit I